MSVKLADVMFHTKCLSLDPYYVAIQQNSADYSLNICLSHTAFKSILKQLSFKQSSVTIMAYVYQRSLLHLQAYYSEFKSYLFSTIVFNRALNVQSCRRLKKRQDVKGAEQQPDSNNRLRKLHAWHVTYVETYFSV